MDVKNKENDYYVSLAKVAKLDEVIPEFEIWLNTNYDFVSLWEKIFNNENFDYKYQDYITFDDWANSDSKSIIKDETGEYFIHPHMLLAFSIEDPSIKINLLSSIFSLPDDLISDFLMKVFGQYKASSVKK